MVIILTQYETSRIFLWGVSQAVRQSCLSPQAWFKRLGPNGNQSLKKQQQTRRSPVNRVSAFLENIQPRVQERGRE